MEITRRSKGGVTILDLTGRLIVAPEETETLALGSAVRELVAEGRVLVAINLAGVTSIDAAGLGALALAAATLLEDRGELTLLAPTLTVRRMISVTRLDTIVRIRDCEGEATRGVDDGGPLSSLRPTRAICDRFSGPRVICADNAGPGRRLQAGSLS